MSYHIAPIEVPGALQTYAQGINGVGRIVGICYDIGGFGHGFTRSIDGSHITVFDLPGALQTFPLGVNDADRVVGYFYHESRAIRGFVCSADGSNGSEIEPPVYYDKMRAMGINNAGQIVCGNGQVSFLRSTDGEVLRLLDVKDVEGLNASGQLVGGVGHRGLVLSANGRHFTFIDLPGAILTRASGINDAGQIVGYYLDHARRGHGFVRSADGSTLTKIDFPGAIETFAQGINDAGQIVGYFDDAAGTHGFLATPFSNRFLHVL